MQNIQVNKQTNKQSKSHSKSESDLSDKRLFKSTKLAPVEAITHNSKDYIIR